MNTRELLEYQADRIEQTLAAKGLTVRVTGGTRGHRLTVFRAVKPASVNLSAITRQEEEVALGLGVKSCRIGRRSRHLTIEVPRSDPETVDLMQLMERIPERRPGAAVVGVDEEDIPLLLPLDSPNVGHALIAGTTGSGKTALARAMIASLVVTDSVHELGLVLIDPKRRGYTPFVGLPHLVHPVVHEPEAALGVLAWAIDLMEKRDRKGVTVRADARLAGRSPAPRIVVFIDELADLMFVAGEEVEAYLTRLVQRGREAGIHVVACTQKPTTSVIGSLVKANFPTRIVGKVTDTTDAYVASGIKGTGAERLLGRGDFLVVAGGDVLRVQGAYIEEVEIARLVTRLRGGRPVEGTEDRAASEKALSFVDRYRGRCNGNAGTDAERKDGRGGHNRKPPTEDMIRFAYDEIVEHGDVSQNAVQDFHHERYGQGCNARRAKAAIREAKQRLQRKNGRKEKGAVT